MAVAPEPETRSAHEWRIYPTRQFWPEVRVSHPRRVLRFVVRIMDRYVDWANRVHIRTLCVWAGLALIAGAGTTYIAMTGAGL